MIIIYTISTNGIPFYVGKTKNFEKRIGQHMCSKPYNKHGEHMISLRRIGASIEFDILDIVSSNKICASDIEVYWIDQFIRAGFKITNTFSDKPQYPFVKSVFNNKHPSMSHFKKST